MNESHPPTTMNKRPLGQALFHSGGESSEAASLERIDDVLLVQEYERQRLGEELHDAAGQLLTSLRFSIARLRGMAIEGGQEELIREIDEIVGQLDSEFRSIAFLQYPAQLNSKGVVRAVKDLALGFGRRTGINTRFTHVGENGDVDDAVSLSLLRVAQEALTNVYRHSRASSVVVVLERSKDELQLTVTDDGIGLPQDASAQASGVGLTSMRHRTEALGGSFSVGNLQRGTRVSATVPVGAVVA